MTTAQHAGNIPTWSQGDRLRKAREAAGLDQRQLADMIGVSRTTVGNAERGDREVRRITLNQWSLATGVPREWLETDESPHPAGPNGGVSEAAATEQAPNASRWSCRDSAGQRHLAVAC